MGKPTNAQLTEKIRILELEKEDMKNAVAHFKEIADTAKGVAEVTSAGIDSLAYMFTNPEPFQLKDKPIYEIERIFYTYHRNSKSIMVVKAENIVEVSKLQEVEDAPLYNRYVADAKRRKEAEELKELFGIQLSFRKY